MVNQVVLIGRITRDLEMRATGNGKEVLSFSIAVNRNFKNASGEYEADFINCVTFNQTAKYMSTYLGKGQLISVTGRIQTRNYENNQGQRVYVTEIIADNVSSLERRQDSQTNNYSNNTQSNNNIQKPTVSPQDFMDNTINQPTYAMDDINDEELPF